MQKSHKRLIFLLSGILLVIAIVVVTLFAFNIVEGKKKLKKLKNPSRCFHLNCSAMNLINNIWQMP
jgi:cell division protein FtsI/penicillin-binding protein 2